MAHRTTNDIRRTLKASTAVSWVFVVAAFALLLIPSAGLLAQPLAGDAVPETTENRELEPWPELVQDDGTINVSYLPELGAWFEDHFAFRTLLVDTDARLYAGLFGVSTTDQVVVGDNGWLYYGGTIEDYQNKTPLRERQARNIAVNMRMMQDYCQAQGANFALVIAPNKNELYPESMPYYYPSVDDASMELLARELEEAGVSWVNLFDLWADEESAANDAAQTLLYFKGDSHWNEKGALVAHDAIASSLGLSTLGVSLNDFIERDDYVGDLATMIYPVSADTEANWYVAGVNDGSGEAGTARSGNLWRYVEGSSVEDSTVRTNLAADSANALDGFAAQSRQAASNNGNLLMLRDSFGNSLLPYFASEFESATFSKMIPYDLLSLQSGGISSVIVERTQRHVDYFAEEAPLMPCPSAAVTSTGFSEADVDIKVSSNAGLFRCEGTIDGLSERWPEGNVYVRLQAKDGLDRTYQAFLISNDENDDGFCLSVSASVWGSSEVTAQVLVGSAQDAVVVANLPLALHE